MAIELLEHNAHTKDFKFNIKGVAVRKENTYFHPVLEVNNMVLGCWNGLSCQIGNPLLKLDRDVPAVFEFFWSHGMISDEVGLTITNECDFDDYSFGIPHNISQKCNSALALANRIVGNYINNYDVILDVCYPSVVEQELRLKQMVCKNGLIYNNVNNFWTGL